MKRGLYALGCLVVATIHTTRETAPRAKPAQQASAGDATSAIEPRRLPSMSAVITATEPAEGTGTSVVGDPQIAPNSAAPAPAPTSTTLGFGAIAAAPTESVPPEREPAPITADEITVIVGDGWVDVRSLLPFPAGAHVPVLRAGEHELDSSTYEKPNVLRFADDDRVVRRGAEVTFDRGGGGPVTVRAKE